LLLLLGNPLDRLLRLLLGKQWGIIVGEFRGARRNTSWPAKCVGNVPRKTPVPRHRGASTAAGIVIDLGAYFRAGPSHTPFLLVNGLRGQSPVDNSTKLPELVRARRPILGERGTNGTASFLSRGWRVDWNASLSMVPVGN